MWRCGSPECHCAGYQRRALAQDQSAANELVRTLTPLVDAVVRKKLPYAQPDERADVRQDTFLRMFKHLGRWQGECPFCLWVRQIAVRAACDQARRNLRLQRLGQAADDPDRLVDAQPPPFSPQVWKCVKRALERLPEDLRRVYDLHVNQGVTVEETAQTVGSVERTIYNRLDRIRRLLLACLD